MGRSRRDEPEEDPGRVAAITDQHDPTGTQLARLVQFVHPERVFGYLPGLDEARLASFYGLEIEAFRALRERFDANAREAARMLLADPVFAARVDRLPFAAGETVAGVGESVTADLQSWLVILRHLLAARRARDDIRVISHGVNGATTAQALCRFAAVLADRPEWIVCCLGSADAVRYGRGAVKPIVSPEETARNLAELRRLAAAQVEAHWVWITPPPVNESLAARFSPFATIQMTARNGDLAPIADWIRRQPETVVDLEPALGRTASEETVLPDGVHPSLAGQTAIAKALVERLTA